MFQSLYSLKEVKRYKNKIIAEFFKNISFKMMNDKTYILIKK